MSETGTILYSLQSNYWNDRMIGRKGCRKGGKEIKDGFGFYNGKLSKGHIIFNERVNIKGMIKRLDHS